MSFSTKRMFAILRKEYMHVMRDPYTLLLALLMPFLVVMILGNSIEFNLREISTVVVDHDKSSESRKLIESFSSSNYFKPYYKDSPAAAFNEILNERAKVQIYIPPNFGQNVRVGKTIDAQILLDGTDNSSVAAVSNYIATISASSMNKLNSSVLMPDLPLKIKERYMFNPELNSKWFAIPGLSAVIIALVALLLTALTICREWEQGSMELLLSTPVRSGELMLGKIGPYAVLSSIGFLIVYLSARYIFGVPFVGSLTLLFTTTFIFIVTYLGIGLYISVTTKTQQIAVQKAMIIGMLPTSLLSGFIFPIEYMPEFLQYLTLVFPPRWYIQIVRNQFLQGSSFADLWMPFCILTSQAIFIISAAILKFKRSLE